MINQWSASRLFRLVFNVILRRRLKGVLTPFSSLMKLIKCPSNYWNRFNITSISMSPTEQNQRIFVVRSLFLSGNEQKFDRYLTSHRFCSNTGGIALNEIAHEYHYAGIPRDQYNITQLQLALSNAAFNEPGTNRRFHPLDRQNFDLFRWNVPRLADQSSSLDIFCSVSASGTSTHSQVHRTTLWSSHGNRSFVLQSQPWWDYRSSSRSNRIFSS